MSTTPIQNLLQGDSGELRRFLEWASLFYEVAYVWGGGKSLQTVRFLQAVLGRQSRVVNLRYRSWVWESGEWVVYGTKRGFSLEVPFPGCPSESQMSLLAPSYGSVFDRFRERVEASEAWRANVKEARHNLQLREVKSC